MHPISDLLNQKKLEPSELASWLEERADRMRKMRQVVADHDVFVWASGILDNLERIDGRRKMWNTFADTTSRTGIRQLGSNASR